MGKGQETVRQEEQKEMKREQKVTEKQRKIEDNKTHNETENVNQGDRTGMKRRNDNRKKGKYEAKETGTYRQVTGR